MQNLESSRGRWPFTEGIYSEIHMNSVSGAIQLGILFICAFF